MEQLIHWISSTALSQAIQNDEWVIPTVQSIHILGVCVVLSSVGMIVLRLLGWAGTRNSVPDIAGRYVPWLWGALIVLALTGSLLVFGEDQAGLGALRRDPDRHFPVQHAQASGILEGRGQGAEVQTDGRERDDPVLCHRSGGPLDRLYDHGLCGGLISRIRVNFWGP